MNQQGIVPFAGAMIEDFVDHGQTPQFKGSVILVTASTSTEARELLERDIYNSKNVWDMSKVQIIPFKVALWPTTSGKAA